MSLPATDRPISSDDLPIENSRSAEDRQLATELFPRSYTGHKSESVAVAVRPAMQMAPPELRGRPVLLRVLAGRLMRPRGH
jgi:hypothetical protein